MNLTLDLCASKKVLLLGFWSFGRAKYVWATMISVYIAEASVELYKFIDIIEKYCDRVHACR